jgi:membrane protease subunit (stomatin/prohibitin family)
MRKHGRKFETPSNVVELPAGDQLQEEPAETPAMPECEHTNHCPTCGAVDDEPCMTKSKKPAAKPHKAREAA